MKKEWKKVRLGDFIDILSGYAFKTTEFIDSGIPVIKIKNVNPPIVTQEDVSFVSEETSEKCSKFILNYNDVLIAMTGSHINQINSVVGRVARVKYYNKTLLNQRVGKLLITDKEHCDFDFVYHFLSQFETKVKLANIAGGAANQANISPNDIKGLEITLPPLPTQQKIASILSAYDDLIENNRKQIKLLEEAAQKLYKEWFVKLNFPGHEKTKIVDGVPEGWKKGVLSDIAQDVGKTVNKKNRNQFSYYLPIDCLPKKSLSYTTFNSIELAESSLVSFNNNDVIFGAMRPYFHKVVIARDKGLTRNTCFVINTERKEFYSFLVMLLFSDETIKYATKISVGTTMPYVRWSDFQQMPITFPDNKIASIFNGIVVSYLGKIKVLAIQIQHLQSARDKLLPRLMSGELEV
ncbi:restriction endonuclease subunit S [Treponema sp.]|uniref:restriction endonuclease subunit S n=1 Tax=Treponema sp. TaxID=166 RepID=UPI003FD82330